VKVAAEMKAIRCRIKSNLAALVIVGALLIVHVGVFSGCHDVDTPPSGSRIVVLDSVSLGILHRFGIDVVGVPSSGFEKVDAKYGDRSKYGDAGTPIEPNYVEIALMNPSEVIMSDATEKAFGNIKSSFEALNIPVKFFDYNGVPELKNSIIRMGEYFNCKGKAQEIVAELELRERAILEKVASLGTQPRILVLFGAPFGSAKDSISFAGSGLYAGSIVTYCGAINVIDELYSGRQGVIKPDNWAPIIDLNPDYIFCTAHGEPDNIWVMYDSIWDTSPWNLISAVRNGNIYYLPDDVAGVIAELDYVSVMQYILDIFDGKVNTYAGGYK
jgi:ABC-type Fe3+-hydroxamate transport system substrate-binding protein